MKDCPEKFQSPPTPELSSGPQRALSLREGGVPISSPAVTVELALPRQCRRSLLGLTHNLNPQLQPTAGILEHHLHTDSDNFTCSNNWAVMAVLYG